MHASLEIDSLDTEPVMYGQIFFIIPLGLAMQAMESATERLLRTSWQGSGVREVYEDFNALTLRITTEALFGSNLSPEQGDKVTGTLH